MMIHFRAIMFRIVIISLKPALVRHFNFFSFGDNYIEFFLAIGALIISFGPLLNAFVAEHVTATLNYGKILLFNFFDTDCANIVRRALV